jgi:aryl-alcohol dehydrogenase-like predicted oxidoreductase
MLERPQTRRRFLHTAAVLAAGVPWASRRTLAAPPSLPGFAEAGRFGAGTYQVGDPALIREALAGGAPILDTSPDYRDGELESWAGRALEEAPGPVFVMTQLPVAAWEVEQREAAFERAMRQSLNRLGRPGVDVLFVRNAEPEQLADPAFRSFARRALARGEAGAIGASGHGPDVEKILALSLTDPLIEVVLFAAYLAPFETIPELLVAARRRGVRLLAMKTREGALADRRFGWEREQARRRHRPWDGGWDPQFTRRALAHAVGTVGADNAILGVRRPEDVDAVLRRT